MDMKTICDVLVEKLGEGVVSWHEEGIPPRVSVAADRVADIAHLLREDPRLDFTLLMCLSGIDWDGYDQAGKGKSVAILGYNEDGTPETSDRVAEGELGVAYHLYSYRNDHKFEMQLRVSRSNPVVPSVAAVWPTAAWHEREAFDLLGIRFSGHPDLRRILLDDAWQGHPLRKDYQMPDRWQDVPLYGQPYSKNPFKKEEPTPPSDQDASGEG
jgi:NADH-quinone oxidoreductase subunit C